MIDAFDADAEAAGPSAVPPRKKRGRSGPLIFYELVMEIRNDEGELVIREKTTRILR